MDDILLMVYVDGNVAPPEREEVETAIGKSAEIARPVALFVASALPYRLAFERQHTLPVLPSLIGLIEAVAHAYGEPVQHRAGRDARTADSVAWGFNARGMSGTPVRSGSRTMVPWSSSAFLAGASAAA